MKKKIQETLEKKLQEATMTSLKGKIGARGNLVPSSITTTDDS